MPRWTSSYHVAPQFRLELFDFKEWVDNRDSSSWRELFDGSQEAGLNGLELIQDLLSWRQEGYEDIVQDWPN